MNIFLNIALVVQIVAALALVGVILIQHGQGADMGTGFGSGASGSLFGASGGATVLSHTTAVLATIFLTMTLVLAYYGYSAPAASSGGSVLQRAPLTQPQAPADATDADESGAADDAADAIPAEGAADSQADEGEGAAAEGADEAADGDADTSSGASQIPAE